MADTAYNTPLDDTELDAVFAAGRAAGPVPSDDLMARILADADAQIAPQPAEVPARPGLWSSLLAGIGGWPAAAGLAAAAITGLMIGVVTPDTLDSLSGGYLSVGGTQPDDLLPSFTVLLGEG